MNTSPYKFAKRLKGQNLEEVQKLLTPKQREKSVVKTYFEEISNEASLYDDASMEEEF